MDGPRQRRPGKPSPGTPAKGLNEEEAVKKASGGWVYSFIVAFLAAILLSFLVFCLIPSPIKAVEMPKFPEAPEFDGPLAPNNKLSYAERIYQNQLSGPESIVVDGDYIYTGTADGYVNVIHAGMVKKLVRFGKGICGGYENENTCGRPLGMRMAKDGHLIVIDAYLGLYQVNVVTGDYTTLYSSSMPVNGKKPKLLNDLDIGPDGKIYFTDSSTRWGRNQFPNIILEGAGSGRLLVYDPATKEVSQLLDGLVFPNGVQLNKDKTAVLIVETCKARVLQFNLKTKKASVWSDNLPGFADNIRYSKDSGTYWLGIAMVRKKDHFNSIDYLADKPWVRGMLAKVMSITGFLMVKDFSPVKPAAIAVELNEKGSIIRSIQDQTGGVIQGVSEVESANGVLYFGSFHALYIGRMYTKKVPDF